MAMKEEQVLLEWLYNEVSVVRGFIDRVTTSYNNIVETIEFYSDDNPMGNPSSISQLEEIATDKLQLIKNHKFRLSWLCKQIETIENK